MDSEYCGQDSTIGTSINCLRRQGYELQKSPSASFVEPVNGTSCGGISMDVVLRSTYDAATHADHVELTDADARVYLEETGWKVTKTVYQDGKLRWMYKAPAANRARAVVFHTLCGAIEEYNNRIADIAQGDESMAKVTLVLRRKRPNPRNKTVTEEDFMSNKRRPSSRLSAKKETQSGAETDSEHDVKPSVAKENFHYLSDLGETDDQDKSPTYADSGHRSRRVQLQSGIMAYGETSKELEIMVNMNEARNYLVMSGWELSEVDRKNRQDWYYKAPESDTYRAGTFQSLCGAISEYNSRVRFTNKTSIEPQPVLKLVRSRGTSHKQKRYTPIDDVKSEAVTMDEIMEEKPACRIRTGSNKSRPDNRSPRLSSKQRKRYSSDETELDVDNLGDSEEEKVTGNLSERFAAAGNSTGDVKSIVGKTFGTLVRDIYEDERNYFLGIHILNLKKENMRIFVENDNLTIKATYSSESTSNKFSAICSGALSCRLTLPDNAIQESVTATQLKPGILNLTIPKSTRSLTKLEIPIR